MAALIPRISANTAPRFQVNYGELLELTKIPYSKRPELFGEFKKQATSFLQAYGIELDTKSVNSKQYPEIFKQQAVNLETMPLLFGNGKEFPRKQTLKGLAKGGVYRRGSEYLDASRPIFLGILKLCSELRVGDFREHLISQLHKFGFSTQLAEEHKKNLSLTELSEDKKRARIEEAIEEMVAVPLDIVLVFLPESDREIDDQRGESLYTLITSQLLRRNISCQVIYENTISDPKQHGNILNQVVPGILAKLGNLPYILAQSLEIADYFIGLDIARARKKNGNGTIAACASVRLYGEKGDFLQYRLADSLVEGEEIAKSIIDDFLPRVLLKGKRALIYRDGRFCGREVENLLKRAKAIGAKLILVECAKSQIPRLYSCQENRLGQPTRGLSLHLSPREAIVVTTQVSPLVGVPKPIRLRVRKEGESVSLTQLVTATLKLTLLHYGSLRDPRLPIPLFGADKIAYRRLQGICPGEMEGDRAFWL